MKGSAFAAKENRHCAGGSRPASAGGNAAAIAPPSYGIDFVDSGMAVVQRVKGNAVAGLSEEQWGTAQGGQTIRYTALAAGCMAVTVAFEGGGGAGVHLAMRPHNRQQLTNFRDAVAGKKIAQVYLDSEFLGNAAGWYVKVRMQGLPNPDDPDDEIDAYEPETEISPRAYSDLKDTMTDGQMATAGWLSAGGSVIDWFAKAFGAPVQTSNNTLPSHAV
jgi:hypothetical protein